MGKYNYDKSALKGLGVGAFLGEVKTRNQHIEAAPSTPSNSWFNPNELAKRLHPEVQYCVISKVVERGRAKSFTLVPDESMGTKELAFFRAGQYASIFLNIDGCPTNMPYSICSSPKDALGKENTSYTFTIERTNPGYASKYIFENWKEGSKVQISGPLGEFYYESLRDAKHVIALAGGSGITPFFSMAGAVADGIEDFKLTILYGNRNEESILLKEEIESIANRSNGKVKVVHVLSDEQKDGYEHGFIDASLIKKYAGEGDYSVFMCGPQAMYKFCVNECIKLGLPKRRYRVELSGDARIISECPNYPQDKKDLEFKLTVNIRGEKKVISCKANQTLLRALEQSRINSPAHCRSGECGWCHSRKISGDVFIPEDNDGRRIADLKFGWIHPCCTYPLSDVEIEIYPTN